MGRAPPKSGRGQHDIGRCKNEAAGNGKPALAEPINEQFDQSGEEQAADVETGDDGRDERETQTEAKPQISADIGERSPRQRPFDESSDDDDARERI